MSQAKQSQECDGWMDGRPLGQRELRTLERCSEKIVDDVRMDAVECSKQSERNESIISSIKSHHGLVARTLARLFVRYSSGSLFVALRCVLIWWTPRSSA